jgi:hypothetical protein
VLIFNSQSLYIFKGSSIPFIEIVPEAVDTFLFDPNHASIKKNITSVENSGSNDKSSLCRLESNKDVEEQETTVLVDGSTVESETSFYPSKVTCNGRGKFTFLSIFKWEHRKGWDVLLKGYWQAFR